MTNEMINKNAPATYLSLVLHDFCRLAELTEWLRRAEDEALPRRLDIAESSVHSALSKDEQLAVFGITFVAKALSPPLLEEYIPTQLL
jgi:hypothetical protein